MIQDFSFDWSRSTPVLAPSRLPTWSMAVVAALALLLAALAATPSRDAPAVRADTILAGP